METLADLTKSLKSRGDAVALVHRTDYRTFRYSFAKLYARACQFAHLLAKHKIKKGDCILIWGPNSPAWVITLCGAMLKGVILVPLDIRSTPDVIKAIQAQVKAKALFCTRYKRNPFKIKTFILEDLELALDEFPDTPPKEKVDPDDLVEILYTSGTTGDPKGVMLTHRNIVSNVRAMQDIEPLSSDDMLLSSLPLSHIFEQTVGLLCPLSQGASVCYIRSIKISAIFDALHRERITIMAIVPRFLETFRKSMLQKSRLISPLSSAARALPRALRCALFFVVHRVFGRHFKYFVVGGAPLELSLERFWGTLGFRVLQGYGLTETSPMISCNTSREKRVGSVGKIIEGVNVKFVDKEIWVKADSITQGYYKNPKKNKESFSGGWFKTGDFGVLDSDGFLFLHGRKKDMIITSGGINVYPEDIEDVLKRIQGVQDACVIGVKHGVEEEVHAVVLLANDINPSNILSLANEKLDSAQQIQDITIWPFEDFPRTPTMKIKKFLVLEHLQSGAKKEEPVGVPDVGKGLFSILRQLVKDSSRIKASATLGSDLKLGSIDRVELVSLVEHEFNIDIDEAEIVQTTTIADVEKMIHERRRLHRKRQFWRWTRVWWCCALRGTVQTLLLFPIVRLFCSPRHVRGLENLRDLRGPVIFVSNHQSHFDTPLIVMHLPQAYRSRIAPAAWQEYFLSKGIIKRTAKLFAYTLVTIFFNTYSFPQTKGFRRSVQYTGELIDDGWSILLFPEGTRSPGEKMLPFKRGIGLIASEMKVAIVPVRVSGVNRVLPREAFWPKRGPVSITFGVPLSFAGESQVQIVKKIEAEARRLAKA